MMRRSVWAASLVGTLVCMPGCVVGDIRDGLQGANSRLDGVDATLGDVHASLAATNEQLSTVTRDLQQTQAQLTKVESQLTLVTSMHESMKRLDAHLASLRSTLSALDGAIPFLDLGGDAPESEEQAVGVTAADSEQPDGGDQGQALAGEESGPTRVPPRSGSRDALVGAWVSVHPSPRVALVVLGDGRYLLDRAAEDPALSQPASEEQAWVPHGVQAGRWAREGTALVLTPDAAAGDGTGGSGSSGGSADDGGGQVWRAEVVQQGLRSLILRVRGRLVVFTKM